MKSAMTQLLKLLFLLLITHYGFRFVLNPVVDHLRACFIPAVHAAPLDNADPAIYLSHMPVIAGGFAGGFAATTTTNTAIATIATLDTTQPKSDEAQPDRRHQISDDCAAYCRKGCEGSTNGICYEWCVYFCARRPPV